MKRFLFAIMLLLPSACFAIPATFTGTSGTKAASVTFDTSGTNLVITLSNTATSDVGVPSDVLTAVFFKITASQPSLTKTSAVSGSGSTVVSTDNSQPQPAGGDVGGEWGYKSGISNAALGSGSFHGISSTGVGLFAAGDRFSSVNLQGPDSLNGVEYGITSAGDIATTGNGGLSGQGLIKNSMLFTLGNLPSGFDPSARITSVLFQYGTNLSEPRFAGTPTAASVPEPASVLLFGTLAAISLGMIRRRSS